MISACNMRIYDTVHYSFSTENNVFQKGSSNELLLSQEITSVTAMEVTEEFRKGSWKS